MKKNSIIFLLILWVNVIFAQKQNYQNLAEQFLAKEYPILAKNENITWKITDQVYSKHNRVTHLYLRPVYDGLEISNWNINLTIYQNKVLRVVGKTLTDVSERMIQTSQNKISAQEAINFVLQHYSLGRTANLVLKENPNGKSQKQLFDKGDVATEDIPAELMYFEKDKRLYLVWDIAIYQLDKSHWWNVKVNAQNGEILNEVDWVTECKFDNQNHTHSSHCHSKHIHNHKTPSLTDNAQYNVFAYPVESPSHGGRSMAINPADVNASPHGWHDTDNVTGPEYTITRGNNVHAYEDIDDTNTPGFSPDGGSSLVFDFPINFSQNPDTYQEAVITNLFYWNNLVHDIYYQYGFDEQSGNFQSNNYGKGGTSGDYVRAEALDGSGTNNANFATPPDGSSGRMQMFVWDGTARPLEITAPSGLVGTYEAIPAGFGPALPTTPITGTVVLADDIEACTALTNAGAIAGNIALIDRGNCAFVDKVLNAQNAGAIAVLVANNTDGLITMGGTEPGITIPSIMITQELGNLIKAELNNSIAVDVSIQDAPIIDKTSDLDNGVIIHEYGHGISTRLTGGPTNSSCLSNSEQMGEGWSDYFALITTMNTGDVGTAPRGIGTYVANQPTTGDGIRPAPYTTDLSINPYTYGDVNSPEITVPHGVGFIWCSILWDMTWLFIERHGYDSDIYYGSGGNNIALQLVMDGLKLQPCNPGFEDGRDAILLADQINNGGVNQDIIWQAFARRGLGFGASQGSSNDLDDGVESFEVPPTITVTKSVNEFILDGDANAILDYEITLKNLSGTDFTGIDLLDALSDKVSYVEGSVSTGGQYNVDDNNITFTNLDLEAFEETTHSFQVEVTDGNEAAEIRFVDDHETENSNWETTGWERIDTDAYSGTHSWFADNVETQTTQFLTLNQTLSAYSNTHLIFVHKYNTEQGFDGGVVEISTDEGGSWQDLGRFMEVNGYPMTIDGSTDSYPAGREAFTGNSEGFISTVVNLSGYNGQNIMIRFIFGTDSFVGEDGWYIDDIYFTKGIETIENQAVATHDGEQFLSNNTAVTLVREGLYTSLENVLENENISIFPNPTTDILNIEIRESITSAIAVTILDMQGRVVMSAKQENVDKILSLNVEELEPSLYFVNIELDGKSYIAKVVIQ